MDMSFLTNMAVWYVVFLFSTTLHEALHAYVSAKGGDNTAYLAGQVTLNPIPHIQRETFGMVVAPLVSFFLNQGSWMIGWASAPYNPVWAARYPKRSFLMSLAGPFSHLPAIVVSFAAMYIGLRTGFFGPFTKGMYPVSMGDGGQLSYALAYLLNVVFQLNTVLFVFNLLPIPPLDGSGLWYLFIKKEEDRLRWQYTSRSYATAGILLAWYVFPAVYEPVTIFFLRVLYSW